MKIRTGFVSNSSSSSFLLYGICLDSAEEDLLIKGFNKLVEEGLEGTSPAKSIYDIDNVHGMTVWQTPWGEIYVGFSWDSVGDDETGAQFKARAETLLERIIPGSAEKCETREHAWMNT